MHVGRKKGNARKTDKSYHANITSGNQSYQSRNIVYDLKTITAKK